MLRKLKPSFSYALMLLLISLPLALVACDGDNVAGSPFHAPLPRDNAGYVPDTDVLGLSGQPALDSPLGTSGRTGLTHSEAVILAAEEYHQMPVPLKTGDALNISAQITASSIANPDMPTGFAKAGAGIIMAILDPDGVRLNISQAGTGYTEAFTLKADESIHVVAQKDGTYYIGLFSPYRLRILSVVIDYTITPTDP